MTMTPTELRQNLDQYHTVMVFAIINPVAQEGEWVRVMKNDLEPKLLKFERNAQIPVEVDGDTMWIG